MFWSKQKKIRNGFTSWDIFLLRVVLKFGVGNSIVSSIGRFVGTHLELSTDLSVLSLMWHFFTISDLLTQ